ncbi:MAG: acyl-ACP--UDP-N-acetylglucosamine O-acyltransferase, partial [Vicinamibacteria bacterium]
MARETKIHPTAIVDSDAVIGKGVHIGPYSIVGPHVKVGDRVRIGPHVVLQGRTDIGEECEIHPFAYVGGPPQDLKDQGERTKLLIGERNVIREYATFHPGTAGGGGITKVGSDGLFMV